MNRTYRSLQRKELAYAYGYSDFRPICARIRAKLYTLTDEEVKQLGEWTGNKKLLPDQVAIIVKLMGTPAHPQNVYSTN